jgi:hypothetical protein
MGDCQNFCKLIVLYLINQAQTQSTEKNLYKTDNESFDSLTVFKRVIDQTP